MKTSDFTIPAGYYPQLPTCVTGTADGQDVGVGGSSGTNIDGHLLSVYAIPVSASFTPLHYFERNLRFPTDDAKKAYCLAKGYLVPWRYERDAIHRLAPHR